jgi:hypothetical protein
MVHLTYAYRFPHWEPVHLPFGPLNFYPLKISTALPLRLRFENVLSVGVLNTFPEDKCHSITLEFWCYGNLLVSGGK